MSRAPAWAAGLLAAAFPALFVLVFDDLEHRLGDAIGSDGGPTSLMAVIAVFFLVWAAMVPVLMRADDPGRAGLYAGLWVALVMVVVLATIVEFLILLLLLGALFGSLAVGGGVLAGGVALRFADGRRSIGPGIVMLVLAAVLALGAFPFLPAATLAPIVWGMWAALELVFIAGGVWMLSPPRASPGEDA